MFGLNATQQNGQRGAPWGSVLVPFSIFFFLNNSFDFFPFMSSAKHHKWTNFCIQVMLYTRIEGAGLYKCAAVQFNLRGVGVSYRGGVRRRGRGPSEEGAGSVWAEGMHLTSQSNKGCGADLFLRKTFSFSQRKVYVNQKETNFCGFELWNVNYTDLYFVFF